MSSLDLQAKTTIPHTRRASEFAARSTGNLGSRGAACSRCFGWVTLGVFLLAGVTAARGQGSSLRGRIDQVISRPEFKHATFGIEFYSLDRQQVVFALNPQELFTPASTTKLLTEGAALALLGADFRFHTRVYRTGGVDRDGRLRGDLVLVASGDPNLSGRIQPDGTLAFENEDHSYGGSYYTRAVPGDPLAVLRDMARQVAAHGVKRIDGRVLADATLFPEGAAELGTGAIISPMIVNDNLIDVTASPGAAVSQPVRLRISPATAYARFVNEAFTGAADSKPAIKFESDTAGPDGNRTVTVTGSLPAGKPSILLNYNVPQPTRFAEIAFGEALAAEDVAVAKNVGGEAPDFKALAALYTPSNLVAEHISPPLAEEVKVTLKVSQNLHASIMPYLLGALLAKNANDPAQAGFDRERQWLESAGLDLSEASQGDGAGGSEAAYFTPDFMVHYLAFMAHQPDFPVFFRALPILGRDGTLWNIQTTSAAAGQVHAKTGTYTADDLLNRNVMVTSKALAGYFTTPSGEHMAFAVYANRVAVPPDEDAATRIVGQAVGEIAAAGYLAAGTPGEPPARGSPQP
jgi:PBP4 family serine-type D-alanyl-D-alanine carboxypeptidase